MAVIHHLPPEKIVCARCQKAMVDDPSDQAIVSHGICTECLHNINGGGIESFLDQLLCPALVTNHEMVVFWANAAAEKTLAKPVHRMKHMRIGTVLECYYSRAPGGCGSTDHCRGCNLRQTINETLFDRQPRYGAYAHQQIMTGDIGRMVQFRFSTTQVKSLMLLLIEEVTVLEIVPSPSPAESRHPPLRRTFAEYFCEYHRLPPKDYHDVMLRRSLPPGVRFLAWPLRLFTPDFFAPDYDFICRLGFVRYPGQLDEAVADFQSHSANQCFWRRHLRMRASPARVSRIFSEIWHAPPGGSLQDRPKDSPPLVA